ncbi:MAG: CDP-alcohol phosphatidyltransferase family protein [Leptospira sp.]|nr:CDP-alcohol phosphatidyltransferase family protein [Leptospira sp.]
MHWKDLFLVPNLLTIGRILLIFPSLFLLHHKSHILAIIFLTIVFLTDFFDGFLARKLNQTSQLGAILDPIADKIVVLVLFTYYFFSDSVPLWYYLLILTRDLAQLSVVPILIFWKKIAFQVKPKMIPKWGTALNFAILGIIVLQSMFGTQELFDVQDNLFLSLLIISGIIEVYILLTFLPRFYQIYRGQHDTFE